MCVAIFITIVASRNVRYPRVLGVIPDGNRRYARKVGISFADAYKLGVQRARELLTYISEKTPVETIYFYTLSAENIAKRSKQELSILFRLFKKQLVDVLTNNPWNARIRFSGRRNLLPTSVQKLMADVEAKTRNADGPTVILAVGYTGLLEIVDMARRIAEDVAAGKLKPEMVDERAVMERLYIPNAPQVDLLLRTSGEMRTSGFLPIETLYAELIFYPKLWPEIETTDIKAVLREYAARERRFGK